MSITFKCPKCGSLCGFANKHAGKKAKCINCGKQFYIPLVNGGKAIVKTEEELPLEGFYRRALVESWKMLIDRANAKMLIFVATIVAIEYFVGYTDFSVSLPGFRLQCPVGIITVFLVRGCLFWFYFEVVGATAFGEEKLPESEIGSGFEIFWNVIKSIYLFVAAFLIVQVPYVLVTTVLELAGVRVPVFVAAPLVLPGAFIFPMALLTFAAGREIWMAGHFGLLIRPIIKAFKPYLVVAGLTAVAIAVQFYTTYATKGGYQEMFEEWGQVGAYLGLVLCLASRVVSIVAMRAIGLFGYHYGCYMPQLQLDE